jgi:hypothetical protein
MRSEHESDAAFDEWVGGANQLRIHAVQAAFREGWKRSLAERDAEIARLRTALAGTESALFEIRDYCAELQDGDTLERLAYRVAGMANGAINDYYAALAGGEDER